MKVRKLLAKAAVSAAVFILAACPAAASSALSVPSATDTAYVTVTGIEHGATVKAYKIAEANYSNAGLNGYEPVTGVSIADLESPALQEIRVITKDLQDGTLGIEAVVMNDVTPSDAYTLGDGSTACTYRAEGMTAGMYLVLVKGVSGNIYNPAIVSVGYDSSSKITSGTLDLSGSSWNVSGGTAEVKHSGVTVSKDTENGIRSYSYDDTVKYVVTAGIPSYDPAVYKDVIFRLVDTADAGLSFDKESVSVEDACGAAVSASSYEVSLSGQTMTVNFDSDWIIANSGTSVTVRYEANMDTDASLDFGGNTNRVKVVYSNDPASQGGATAYDDPDDPGAPRAESTVYTFDFSFKKVDSADPLTVLTGAEFSLTGTNTTGDTVTYSETSSGNGTVHFAGLSEGTYTMKETRAPEGYAVNQSTYTVTVSASYSPDKTLSNYTVNITDEEGSSFMNKTYLSTPSTDGGDGAIPNTAFKDLPATGGTGTVMFSIAGAAAVSGGTLLLLRRRKGSGAGMFCAARQK